jgi:hypothetical protein
MPPVRQNARADHILLKRARWRVPLIREPRRRCACPSSHADVGGAGGGTRRVHAGIRAQGVWGRGERPQRRRGVLGLSSRGLTNSNRMESERQKVRHVGSDVVSLRQRGARTGLFIVGGHGIYYNALNTLNYLPRQ